MASKTTSRGAIKSSVKHKLFFFFYKNIAANVEYAHTFLYEKLGPLG